MVSLLTYSEFLDDLFGHDYSFFCGEFRVLATAPSQEFQK